MCRVYQANCGASNGYEALTIGTRQKPARQWVLKIPACVMHDTDHDKYLTMVSAAIDTDRSASLITRSTSYHTGYFLIPEVM
ncbi:protein of unknown function [Methylocaldum szegediense]|uniref:Uncharacterized protein n=1 Tax=Methylocaldum szegediense TaxID=73780 RepID=A0ABN8X1U4_9GAMM|nr:protein of unknown function [Methylocaldum szegediense]